ncbi:MAG: hypothetical protein ABIH83_04690 [Candidatus Micrarchaeota archaeon]
MYHPGKVVEVVKGSDKGVVSADAIVKATLEMWDENVLTFAVSPKIAAKIKEGQIVLVDYRPDEKHEPPVPVHMVVSIVEGKKARKIWNAYKEMLEKRKRKPNIDVKKLAAPQAQSYIA